MPFLSTRVAQVPDGGKTSKSVPHLDLAVRYAFDLSDYGQPTLCFDSSDVIAATDACWNRDNTETSYQPSYVDFGGWNDSIARGAAGGAHPAEQSLTLSAEALRLMRRVSALARFGPRLMHEKRVRQQVLELERDAELSQDCCLAAVVGRLLRGLLAAPRGSEAHAWRARRLNDLYIALGWLEKYFLFEDYETTGDCCSPSSRSECCSPSRRSDGPCSGPQASPPPPAADSDRMLGVYIPQHTLARPYTLLARAFGNHEEFTYYNHYVGSSCSNMEEMRAYMREHVDFGDPQSIKAWVLRFESLYDFQRPCHEDSADFPATLLPAQDARMEALLAGREAAASDPVPAACVFAGLAPSEYALWDARSPGQHRSSRHEEGFPELSEFLVSERYFRFIHLAMEMVWSDKIAEICALLRESAGSPPPTLSPEGSETARDKIEHALDMLLEVERRMNLTFKSLPLGSNPAHYNRYVRPYIAGTWGRNCGSVYHARGKFFQGCGEEHAVVEPGAMVLQDAGEEARPLHLNSLDLEPRRIVGRWKKHVGQTGAGTTVRPIGDEFAGGVSEVYTRPLPPHFTLALMRDLQLKVQNLCREAVLEPDSRNPIDAGLLEAERAEGGTTFIADALSTSDAESEALAAMEDPEAELSLRRSAPAVSALTLMLTMFRAVTRPYSHNAQIQDAKELFARVQTLIDDRYPELKLSQLKLQLACLTHRLDHYHYVQFYINDFGASGKQLRTAATGGSNTTDFLPDLIDSNMSQARALVGFFKGDDNLSAVRPGGSLFALVEEIERKLDEFAAGKAMIRTRSQSIKDAEELMAPDTQHLNSLVLGS